MKVFETFTLICSPLGEYLEITATASESNFVLSNDSGDSNDSPNRTGITSVSLKRLLYGY